MYIMKKNMAEQLIDDTLFQNLLQTAALKRSAEEAAILKKELNEQVKIIRQLDSISLSEEIEPVIHGNPYPTQIRCKLRDDISIPFEKAAEITAQTPVVEDGYIVSPDVPHRRIA